MINDTPKPKDPISEILKNDLKRYHENAEVMKTIYSRAAYIIRDIKERGWLFESDPDFMMAQHDIELAMAFCAHFERSLRNTSNLLDQIRHEMFKVSEDES